MKRGGRRIEAEVVEDAVGWTHHGRCPGETRARNPEVLRPSTVPRGSSPRGTAPPLRRSEEHTSELQSRSDLVCRLLLEKKKSDDSLMTSHGLTNVTRPAAVTAQ